MGEELRVVLKKYDDIAALRRARRMINDIDVNNREAVRHLISCFYELRGWKEKKERQYANPSFENISIPNTASRAPAGRNSMKKGKTINYR